MALFCNLETRQLSINNKRTSIALEPLFWSEIEKQASASSLSWRAWVRHVLSNPHKGRASALRVAVLKALMCNRFKVRNQKTLTAQE
ncbi:MAG: aryl-sulfate sulfotransferase [Chloroflexota bacterium]|nr:MAG: aryl-sulfate sulfotransferase [Chloroflexota bacterium]